MKVLLHICCAPCACYPYKTLNEKGIDIVGMWYNPNIHPYTEYHRRMMSAGCFAQFMNLKMIWKDYYYPEEWLKKTYQAWEEKDEGNLRCYQCWLMRLGEVAQTAKVEGMEAFSTTLLHSKYQKHEMVKEIGYKLQNKFDIKFYYEDFRKGWNDGISISKELGLYRQQYCGCIFSERDRYRNREQRTLLRQGYGGQAENRRQK